MWLSAKCKQANHVANTSKFTVDLKITFHPFYGIKSHIKHHNRFFCGMKFINLVNSRKWKIQKEYPSRLLALGGANQINYETQKKLHVSMNVQDEKAISCYQSLFFQIQNDVKAENWDNAIRSCYKLLGQLESAIINEEGQSSRDHVNAHFNTSFLAQLRRQTHLTLSSAMRRQIPYLRSQLEKLKAYQGPDKDLILPKEGSMFMCPSTPLSLDSVLAKSRTPWLKALLSSSTDDTLPPDTRRPRPVAAYPAGNHMNLSIPPPPNNNRSNSSGLLCSNINKPTTQCQLPNSLHQPPHCHIQKRLFLQVQTFIHLHPLPQSPQGKRMAKRAQAMALSQA